MGRPIPLNIRQSYGILLITGRSAYVIFAVHVFGGFSVPAGPRFLNNSLIVGANRFCFSNK